MTQRFLNVMMGEFSLPTDLMIHSPGAANAVGLVYAFGVANRVQDNRAYPKSQALIVESEGTGALFSRMLSGWMSHQEALSLARFKAYQHLIEEGPHPFNQDRLVRAVNAFHSLPDEWFPKQKKKKGASVQSKIETRAKVITGKIGPHLPDIESVIKHAADARNGFVHAGAAGIGDNEKYEQYMPHQGFLTRCVEFVFMASDLIDSGWDVADWVDAPLARYQSLDHPLRLFLNGYEENKIRLLASLPKTPVKK